MSKTQFRILSITLIVTGFICICVLGYFSPKNAKLFFGEVMATFCPFLLGYTFPMVADLLKKMKQPKNNKNNKVNSTITVDPAKIVSSIEELEQLKPDFEKGQVVIVYVKITTMQGG